jgi:CheY-like chemotaxis protein
MASVLVVDDDSDFRDWTTAILRNRGHAVVATSSVRFIVERAHGARLPLVFDAAIIDMLMPEMDGIETIRTLKRLTPSIKIIAVSGGGEHGDADGYLRMAERFGAVGRLAKPFSAADLYQVLEQILPSS